MVRVRVWVRFRVKVRIRVRVSFSVCKSASGLHCAPAPDAILLLGHVAARSWKLVSVS